MGHQVKNLTGIHEDVGWIPGPGNFHMPWLWPKQKTKTKTKELQRLASSEISRVSLQASDPGELVI